jgi:hypothetical protein
LSRSLFQLALLALFWSAEAMAEPSPTRGVVVFDGMKLAPKVPQAHERMRTHLQAALARENWTVIWGAGTGDCDHACMSKLADASRAKHVLRLTGDRNQDDGYDVVIELLQPTAADTRKTNAYCDYCTIERMAEVAGRAATQMLASAASEETPVLKKESAVPAHPPLVPVPPTPPPEPHATPSLVTPPAGQPTSHGWLPWTLLAVGAAGVGYGVWAVHEDGKATGTCSPSRTSTCDHYHSQTIGIIALTGGGLLAATGVVWEIVRLTRRPEIALSPNAVALTMRF